MKKTTCLLLVTGLSVFTPAALLAQSLLEGVIGGIGLAAPVQDIITEINTGLALIPLGQTATSTGDMDTWMNQIMTAEQIARWVTQPLGIPTFSQAVNQIGETLPWSPAMATGVGGDIAWGAATVNLGQLAGILIGLGNGQSAQLATSEIINALGINNIGVIGASRSFLATNATQLAALQTSMADGSPGLSGPTQQLSFVANSSAQNTNINTQQLAVSTATLETVTAIAKVQADTATTDNNSTANIAIYQALGPQSNSFGTAFANEQ